MKKLIMAALITLLSLYSYVALAKEAASPEKDQPTLQPTSSQPSQVKEFVDNLNKCSNDHDINCLKTLYSQNFVSGDGLKYDDFFKLVQQTWKDYPNIKYVSEIENVDVNNNFASIESFDKSDAQTAQKSNVTDDFGVLESCSRNILYLQKYGKSWKISSDKILSEKTAIKYGKAKDIKMDFIAPNQVYAGDDYTASLNLEIPDDIVAIGSITHEPIIYPEAKQTEVFRQVPTETGLLERVMKANKTNNNELTSASVGLTEMTEDLNQNAVVKLSGLALILTRVNVIPQSNYIAPLPRPKAEDNSLNDEELPHQTPKS